MNQLFASRTHRVVFSSKVYGVIGGMYTESADTETELHAVLIGHYSEDLKTAIVDDIFEPTRGGPYTVDISEERAKEFTVLLKRLWEESRGNQFYLGDWHSHPSNPNTPSQTDIDTSRAAATHPGTQCPQLIMAISGSNGLGVHVVTRDDLIALTPVADPCDGCGNAGSDAYVDSDHSLCRSCLAECGTCGSSVPGFSDRCTWCGTELAKVPAEASL